MKYRILVLMMIVIGSAGTPSFAQIIQGPVVPLTENMLTCEVSRWNTWVTLNCGGQPLLDNRNGSQFEKFLAVMNEQGAKLSGQGLLGLSYLRSKMREAGFSENCIRQHDSGTVCFYIRSPNGR